MRKFFGFLAMVLVMVMLAVPVFASQVTTTAGSTDQGNTTVISGTTDTGANDVDGTSGADDTTVTDDTDETPEVTTVVIDGVSYQSGEKAELTGIFCDEAGTWWYVNAGQVDTTFTGIAKRADNNTWWYVKAGQVDVTFTGIAKRPDNNTWWYVKNGQVDFTFSGITKRKDNNTWWLVKKGRVNFNYTGVAKRPDNNTWWYVKNGKVDFTYSGVAKRGDNNTWWFVSKGKVNFSYSGLGKNSLGVWYIKNGKVDFTYSGHCRYKGSVYTIVKGKLQGSLRNIDPNKPMIALTYDDGPYSPVTNRILKCLKDNGGVCTFFVVGNRVNTYKSSVKAASDMGCQIANHTWDHTSLTSLSAASISTEISKCNTAVYNVTGLTPSCVRPVGGAVNSTVKTQVGVPMILWSIDTEDWSSRNATSVYNKVIGHVKDGDIVLMHDLYTSTATASEAIIPKLVAQGYQLVTVDELAYYKGYNLKGHTTYSQFR